MDRVLSVLVFIFFIFIVFQHEKSKYRSCKTCGIDTTRAKENPWQCDDCIDGIKR